jgi:hypothetical protein
LKINPSFKKALIINLEKSRSNPFSGKAMHSLPKTLRQKVFQLWIGGKDDFRFIYYVDRNSESVMGIYITTVPRANFSYEQGDWLEILNDVVTDQEEGRMDNFFEMNTEAAAKAVM